MMSKRVLSSVCRGRLKRRETTSTSWYKYKRLRMAGLQISKLLVDFLTLTLSSLQAYTHSKMPGSGSCSCGNIALEYSGKYCYFQSFCQSESFEKLLILPVASGYSAITALCHCADCQKWSASAFSCNVIVPTSAFSILKGHPKSWSRIALVSGKPHAHFFCGGM